MLPTPSIGHVPFERIYEPSEDSFLLLDTLSNEAEKGFLRDRFKTSLAASSACPVVVEVGLGSGVVLAFLTAHAKSIFGRDDILALGADLNNYACSAAQKTVAIAQEEQRSQMTSHGIYLSSIVSDLATCFKPAMVDVLIFNPPYVPTSGLPDHPGSSKAVSSHGSDEDLLALSYAGGRDGMEVTDRLLGSLPGALCSDRGCAYIILCAQNKPEDVKHRIQGWGLGWKVETVASSGSKGGWEKLQVIRIWRSSQPHHDSALA